MKKKTSNANSLSNDEQNDAKVSEAGAPYVTNTPVVNFAIAGFSQKQFQAIVNKSPFSQAQWADLLFLSERTLQRYAKSNTEFSGLHRERILQLEKLIDFGNSYFAENFNEWLFSFPFSLQGKRPFDYLFTYEGIKKVHLLIGRMQHGLIA